MRKILISLIFSLFLFSCVAKDGIVDNSHFLLLLNAGKNQNHLLTLLLMKKVDKDHDGKHGKHDKDHDDKHDKDHDDKHDKDHDDKHDKDHDDKHDKDHDDD